MWDLSPSREPFRISMMNAAGSSLNYSAVKAEAAASSVFWAFSSSAYRYSIPYLDLDSLARARTGR